MPVAHPDLVHPAGERTKTAEGEKEVYPLLTLPEQRRSRQSPQASSLAVERSSSEHIGRTSAKLPEDRRRSQLSVVEHPTGEEAEAGPGPSTLAARATAARRLEGMDDREARPMSTNAPSKDLESGRLHSLRRSPSRVSLPLQRRESAERGFAEDGDEYEWGPSHPCFPHMNPHVPLDSPLYQSTRIIRVQRDWMQVGDLAPTFTNLYPEILDAHISEEQFRDIVKHINTELIAAFSPWTARAWADAIMGVATLWLWEDLGFAGVKRKLKKLEKWIASWNRDVGAKDGIAIIPLRRTAYLSVSLPPSRYLT